MVRAALCAASSRTVEHIVDMSSKLLIRLWLFVEGLTDSRFPGNWKIEHSCFRSVSSCGVGLMI